MPCATNPITSQPDALTRRLGVAGIGVGVALTLAAIATVTGAVVDPFADITSAHYLSAIAGAPQLWLGVHLAIAVGVVCKLVGLLSIAEFVDGPRARLVRVANLLAVTGSTLFVVTMVFDGYVHGYLADRWLHAGPAGRTRFEEIFGASLRTSYGMEIASVLVLLGAAPIVYGLAMRGSRVFPLWQSRLAIGGGSGAVLTAVVLWIGGPSAVGYGLLYPVFALIVPVVWLLGTARSVWRAGRTGRSVPAVPVAAATTPPARPVAV